MRVYFIRCENWVKIGTTRDVDKRVKQLQTGSIHKLRLLGSISGGFPTEKYIHGYLDNFRGSGEWFCFTEEFVKTYVGLCLGTGKHLLAEEIAESKHRYFIEYDEHNVPRPHTKKQIKHKALVIERGGTHDAFIAKNPFIKGYIRSYWVQSLSKRLAEKELKRCGASCRVAKRILSEDYKKAGRMSERLLLGMLTK